MRYLLLMLAACAADTGTPTPTGAECPSPDPMQFGYTLETTPGCTGTPEQCNFGKTFMDRYCVSCHSSTLEGRQRNGAPWGHDYDTFLFTMRVATHADRESGIGPLATNRFMPGAGTSGKCPSTPGGPLDEKCPEPTDQEREDLAAWVACEVHRPHDF